ncbi:MAG: PilC/PilY family type IV pilus protein [Dyella sp.]
MTTYTCTQTVATTTTTTTPYNGGFYYVCPTAGSSTGCVYHQVNSESAAIKQNFANWYSYYRTRNLNARAAIGRVFGSLSDNAVRTAGQTLQSQSDSSRYNASGNYVGLAYGPLASTTKILEFANPANCTASSISDSCWRSQFMNWIYGVPASGGTPTRVATQTAGKFFTRTLDTANPQRDPYWNGSTSSPAEISCRKNFNMLVTDGFWNGDSPDTVSPSVSTGINLPDGKSYSTSDPNSKIYWNQSGTTTPSLADIAFYYWATDLRSNLTNNVPAYYPDLSTGVTGASTQVDAGAPGNTGEVYFNPANDPATWQHMSQYMVTMGVSGSLNYPGDYTALRKGTKQWPTPTTGGGTTNIDDTWHAALSSRGGYFSAADPTSLVNSLKSILSSVIASSSSALNLSLNTQVLTSNSVGYYAGYNTTDYSGTLNALSINTDGTVGSSVWQAEAGSQLTNRASTDPRFIVTSSGPGAGKGVTFSSSNFSSLSSAEQAALNSPDGTGASNDGLGKDRVDWLTGTRSKEGTTFRTRTSLLGAIFNSQPAYVGPASGGYSNVFPAGSPEATALASNANMAYSAFVSTQQTRPAVVYVGANDGMLHAFDARLSSVSGANPGRELWAYVPASVYANLPAQSRLAQYSFTPTVDGSPVTGDVFFGADNATNNSVKGWHTLLVGSLRYGGRGVFAIDITDPRAVSSASTAAQKVLWEFNSASTDVTNSTDTPANMGYSFGTPTIGRLPNGKWVVLVPGGYFPDGSTAAAAGNTYSSLFVLDAQTGTVLKEIRTPSGTTSYGLSTPVLGDYDGDQVADVAFAGDLAGNVWRIDLSAALANSSQTAGVSLLFQPATAGAQSITTSPRLIADPTSNDFIVIFGTGRYLATSDTPDITTQALYGIRDPGTAVTTPVTLSNLTQQSLTVDSATGGIGVTGNAVAASSSGWYLLLNNPAGERVVVTPAIVTATNTVIFSTLIPSASDPCTTASSGSLIALNASNGNAANGVNIGVTVSLGTGFTLAGGRTNNAASAGSLYAAASASGSTLYFVGKTSLSSPVTMSASIPTSRRRSWRSLNNEN